MPSSFYIFSYSVVHEAGLASRLSRSFPFHQTFKICSQLSRFYYQCYSRKVSGPETCTRAQYDFFHYHQNWSTLRPRSARVINEETPILHTLIRYLSWHTRRRVKRSLRLWSSWLLITSECRRYMAKTLCPGGRNAGGRLYSFDTT